MRPYKLISAFLLVLVFSSCQKESSTNNDGSNVPLEFVSLQVDTNVVAINAVLSIKAVAKGSNLTYTWLPSEGTILGSGAEIVYTICHATTSTVTCTVKDGSGNKDTKSIQITSN